MRERVEDLGRISVMIDTILDLDLWELYRGRNKDFVEHFQNLSSEHQDELLHNLIYGLSNLRDAIFQIAEIADGRDPLNEPAQ